MAPVVSMQHQYASKRTIKGRKFLQKGDDWVLTPPVASARVSSLLKKGAVGEEVLLTLSTCISHKFTVVEKLMSDDGRKGIHLQRALEQYKIIVSCCRLRMSTLFGP